MNCKRCGGVMVIDGWAGLVWTCFNCGFIGSIATNDEIKKQEEE